MTSLYIFIALGIGIFLGAFIMLSYMQSKLHKQKEQYHNSEREWIEGKQSLLSQIQVLNVQLDHKTGKDQQDKERVEHLRNEFQVLSSKIYEQQHRIFGQQSSDTLTSVLQPLKERIQSFRMDLDKKISDQIKEQYGLKLELASMNKATHQIVQQTHELTSAIKTDMRIQGSWGEMILEKALELSGLRKNQDYVLQGEGLKLKDESGKAVKPDVIIFLPKGKYIVIDAKMPFTSYSNVINHQEDEQKLYEKAFIKAIRQHIDGLASKTYYKYVDIYNMSAQFVMMFIPMEPAYMLALKLDPSIVQEALNKKIILTSPSTLFVSLKLVSDLWKFDRVNQNALEIVQSASLFYNKLNGVVSTIQKAINQMQILDRTLHEVSKQVYQGKGNLLDRASKLESLSPKKQESLRQSIQMYHDHEEDDISSDVSYNTTSVLNDPLPKASKDHFVLEEEEVA